MKPYYYNSELSYQEMRSLDNPANPSLLSFINIISEQVDLKDGSILDLGCGTGEVTTKFLSISEKVEGIDVSPSAITLASHNFPAINFRCSDLVEGELGEDYQLIFDSHTIHGIVYDHEREKVFKKIYKALKAGGVFAMETMVAHDDLCFAELYHFNDDYQLFKNVDSNQYYGICKIDGQLYIPYRRVLPSFLIEQELKRAGFTIIYLIVSSSQKIVVDSSWPFAIDKDPDRMRVICIKEPS